MFYFYFFKMKHLGKSIKFWLEKLYFFAIFSHISFFEGCKSSVFADFPVFHIDPIKVKTNLQF